MGTRPGSATLLAIATVATTFWVPAVASAHTAGPLDRYGCHDDRRRGGYHCHVGDYSGLDFSSKHKMLTFREEGLTEIDIRKARGEDVTAEGNLSNAAEEENGWRRWVPFAKRSETSDAGNGEVIIPRGLEQRLMVLKDLHEKGLISEEEYAQKRQEILGDL